MKKENIVINNHEYKWDETINSYFGQETSCGTHGATEVNGKWVPSYWGDGSCDFELASESFDDLESALKRSHSYWT